MAESSRHRNVLIAVVVAIIALLLLLTRCKCEKPVVHEAGTTPRTPAKTEGPATAGPSTPGAAEPVEVLGAATLKAPEKAAAGAAFNVDWTGPGNRGDFVAIVRSDAPANANGNYRETKDGNSLELTAPMEIGAHEIRYVTGRSRTVLARVPIEVEPAGATLDSAAEVVLGTKFSVTWTGPNNKDDYVTIVAKDARDDQYGDYVNTEKGSPLILTAPTTTGDAELRYVSGQGRKVLGRRAIKVVAADVSISAPAEAVAGSRIEVVWTGPNNSGDYITVVPRETPDGQYSSYTNTSSGSPLKLLLPIMVGEAELRYMTGQGAKVLGRRSIRIVAAEITLLAPAECKAGADVSVTWTGPNNSGDYITIVPKGTPDGQYAAYSNTTKGSPLYVKSPKEAGDAEIRYASGQGNKVLARIPIRVVP